MALRNEVTKLINSVGKTLTLRKVTEGSYDPSTGGISNTTADTTTKGMLLNYMDMQFDGDIIQHGDRKIVLRATDSVTPEIQDIVLDGSVEYRLIDVRQIEEAGVDIVYICQGRQ